MSVEAIILTDDSADRASGLMQYIPTPSICHLQQYVRKGKQEMAGGLERSLGWVIQLDHVAA
jgi:hypothetical protein